MAVMRVKEPFNNVKGMTRLPPKGLTVKGIVHWNNLATNEINKNLFFSEDQKCFVLGWRSQNSDETKYHLHISETFISTICSLDSNIRFIKPPKAQQLCWSPTLEASLDKIRIISTQPNTVLFVSIFSVLFTLLFIFNVQAVLVCTVTNTYAKAI